MYKGIHTSKNRADRFREMSLEYAFRPAIPLSLTQQINYLTPPKPKKPKHKHKTPKGSFHGIGVLIEFWRENWSEKSKESKLARLKYLAEYVIKKFPTKRLRKRKAFDAQKAYIWRLLGQKCWVCEEQADHRHHIIQLQNGGNNSPKNIIPLCEPCHAEVHPWLKE